MWSFSNNFIYFLIGGKLLYNFVLISAVQQCESIIIIYIYAYIYIYVYIYIPSLLSLPPLPPSPLPLPLIYSSSGIWDFDLERSYSLFCFSWAIESESLGHFLHTLVTWVMSPCGSSTGSQTFLLLFFQAAVYYLMVFRLFFLSWKLWWLVKLSPRKDANSCYLI